LAICCSLLGAVCLHVGVVRAGNWSGLVVFGKSWPPPLEEAERDLQEGTEASAAKQTSSADDASLKAFAAQPAVENKPSTTLKKAIEAGESEERKRTLFYGAFTWGSPGWLKLKKREHPRVQGLRIYTAKRSTDPPVRNGSPPEVDFTPQATCKADMVPQMAGAFGFVHPLMPALAVSESKECSERIAATADKVRNAPSGDRYIQDPSLHTLEKYNELMPETDKSFPVNRSEIKYLMECSYQADERRLPKEFPLPLAGAAYDEVYKQHSWLFIREEDRQCFLTFKGSASMANLTQALSPKTKSWCNLGKVHAGFVKRMTAMLQAKHFVDQVKVHMEKECKGVAVFGHSMGGALAEMFAACFLNPDYVTLA